MAGKTDSKMRYLKLRGGAWSYVRRVPGDIHRLGLDGRGELIQRALGTSDAREARLLRDKLEREDNRLWQTLRDLSSVGGERWQAATDLQNLMGFSKIEETDYKSMSTDQRHDLVDRALAAAGLLLGKDVRSATSTQVASVMTEGARPITDALTGRIPTPDMMLSALPDFYLTEIIGHKLDGKSPAQRERAERWPRLAARHFVETVGDRKVEKVTRADALAFRKHLIKKLRSVNPKTGRPYTGDAANREVGSLRTMLGELALHLAWPDFRNPFDDISFDREKVSRAPIPLPMLQRFVTTDALAGMDASRRAIYLILIETGARLSEVCNLRPDAIVLDHEVPHIVIAGTDEREVKTTSSHRKVPLVGIALEAAKRYPGGWPDLFDQENPLSAAFGKYLKENKLVEGRQAPVHGLRHAMKDRLRAADVRPDLIDQILGHAAKGPKYGDGFPLEMMREALLKVALPFDRAALPCLTVS